MEEASDGGMIYTCTTHISHEVGFQFLEMTLPLIQQAFDVTKIVNPGMKNILKQCVGYLPFLHNLVPTEGRI
eukprot:11963129-Ditylum_brightwellii.AAC.1